MVVSGLTVRLMRWKPHTDGVKAFDAFYFPQKKRKKK